MKSLIAYAIIGIVFAIMMLGSWAVFQLIYQ